MKYESTNTNSFTRKLSEVATIRQGYHFRKKVMNDPSGNTYVIQASDIGESHKVMPDRLIKVQGSKIKPVYHLSPGSLLVKSRGTDYSASSFGLPGITAVAAYHFIVVAITSKDINPEYLCWYINRPETQYQLSLQAGGSYIKSLPAQALANLKIIIPPMQQQELIANVNRLIHWEASLIDEIKAKRAQLIQGILNNSVSGTIRTQ